MTRIRLVVSDLDGTLLSDDHRLTRRVLEAVGRFQEQGGLFTLATGRPHLTAHRLAEELQLEIPYIACNGSVLAGKEGIIQSHLLPLADLAVLLMEAARQGMDVLMFREEDVRVFERTLQVKEYERKELVRCRLDPVEEERWTAHFVHKVILMGPMEVLRSLWERHEPFLGDRYTALQSEDNYLEIVSRECTKGAAMLKLADSLGIDRGEIMAIGNQMNDLDMLQHAALGVAVNNSSPELKKQAHYVSEGNYGDGVIEALLRFAYPRPEFTPHHEMSRIRKKGVELV